MPQNKDCRRWKSHLKQLTSNEWKFSLSPQMDRDECKHMAWFVPWLTLKRKRGLSLILNNSSPRPRPTRIKETMNRERRHKNYICKQIFYFWCSCTSRSLFSVEWCNKIVMVTYKLYYFLFLHSEYVMHEPQRQCFRKNLKL